MIMPNWLLKYLPIILTGVAWVLTFGIGYWQGYKSCTEKWVSQSQTETNQYLAQINELTNMIRQEEIQAQSKINQIVNEHVENEERIRNEYQTVIDGLRDNQFEFNGVRDCPTAETTTKPMSGSTGTAPDLVCYSKSELQEKIARSLAIAEECDEIAEKYNRLIEVYYVRTR